MGVGAGLYMCDVVKKVHVRYLISWWVLVYIRNNNGPNTLPWGIPLVTASQSEKLLLTLTLDFLLFKKSWIHLIKVLFKPYEISLEINLLLSTLSKAFSKSLYVTSTWPPYSRYSVHLSIICSNCSEVDLFLANVNSRSRSLYAIARPSVVCLSVTFVRPTQAVQIFRNISMAFGTLAIRWHPLKISRRSSQGNPSAGGVKHKRGSKI